MPEKYVRRDGLPLLLRHTGPTTLPERPPRLAPSDTIVCLHDAGLQSSVFAELIGVLGSDEDAAGALAFDLPGHGRSGSLDALPSIEAMAGTARWVAGWCGLERAWIVGHGMGALVALEWARTGPDSVAGLVLCGTGLALGIDDPTLETMRRVTQGKAPRPFDPSRVAKGASPDLVRRAYMEGIQTDPRATLVDLEACRRWADAFDPTTLPTIGSVRVVCGEDEAADGLRRAESLASALAGGELERVEHAAHFLPLERPDAVAASIAQLREGT